MRTLALDLSTSTGYAVLDSEGSGLAAKPVLVDFGVIKLPKCILEYGPYPWCYFNAATWIAAQVCEIKIQFGALGADIDRVVIEETHLGKNRYAQKILEFIHAQVLLGFHNMEHNRKVLYLSSSEWRSNLGLTMTAGDKTGNRKLSEMKSVIKSRFGDLKCPAAREAMAEAKKKFGIKGKINKKHLAIRFVNEFYGLNLKMKDDDVADAICLGLASINNATPCDGV